MYPSTRTVPHTTQDVPNISSVSSAVSSQSTVYRDLSQDRLPKKCKGDQNSASLDSLLRTGSTITQRSQATLSTLVTVRSSSSLARSSSRVDTPYAPVSHAAQPTILSLTKNYTY